MSSQFEKFIRNNRKEFDTESPSASVWEKIEGHVPAKHGKKYSARQIYAWSAAASVIFIALTCIYFLVIRQHSHGTQSDPVVKVSPGENKNDYNSQFDATYRWIGEKQSELKQATANQPQLYQQFIKDQSALVNTYQELLKQAAHSPNRDLINEAMAQNLQLQFELLERQINISKQITNDNDNKKQSHEKNI
jgi:hypothetical protein